MSLATIRNSLVGFLAASGPWAASEISTCSFGVLESVSGSAVVLQPGPSSDIAPFTMDGQAAPGAYIRNWSIRGGLYIKDNGDAESVLGSCWQAHDDLYSTFAKSDRPANSGAQIVYLKRIGFPPANFERYGGALWAVVDFEIAAEEF